MRTDYLGPVLPQVYRAPNRNWTRDSWDAALAGGTANHMSRERGSNYASIYTQITHLGGLQQREEEISSNLAFLAQDQILDQRSRIDAINNLAELDRINTLIVLVAGQVAESAKELGVRLNRADAQADFRGVLKRQRLLRGACVQEVPAVL